MKPKRRSHDGRSAIDILEEALHLLRASPLLLAPYYIGSLPFILGLLYFWTDMSTGADAWRHCAQAAWGLVLLFIWMKTWQSMYANRLLVRVRGDSASSFGIGHLLRAAALQTAIQPWSMICLPLAFMIMVPFPQALAFFQNATLIGSGDEKDMRRVIQKSWHQASLWPMQNTLILWLTSPFLLIFAALILFVLVPVSSSLNPGTPAPLLLFITSLVMIPLCPLGMVTALNTGMALFLAPWLLKTLLGMETLFSMSSAHLMNNTFFAVVCSLSYLCLDPLLKACYCLRCFYGESLHSGEDLKADLRSLARPGILTAIFLVIFLTLGPVDRVPADSQGAGIADHGRTVPAQRLDSAIESILEHPEYAWRMPREKPPEAAGGRGALHEFLESILNAAQNGWTRVKKWLIQLWDFIKDLFSRISPSLPNLERPQEGWTSFQRVLIIIPLACIVAVLAFLAWRAWKDRKPRMETASVEMRPTPDITREEVDAALLPEDGWLALARELTEKGELRLALRALYLATLVSLARQDLIAIARYKSDREYEMELRRRSHSRPHLVGVFAENRALFESAWYGLHEVTPGIMERFSRNQERIRADAQE